MRSSLPCIFAELHERPLCCCIHHNILCSSILKSCDPFQDPIKVTRVLDLKCPGPSYTLQNFELACYGYWLIFRNFEDLNETWVGLRERVISGDLGAVGATCSTLRYDPSKCRAGPQTTGKIRILTKSEHDYMDVGMKLIQLDEVRHDIKYKTIQSSYDGVFSHVPGNRSRITLTTLFWNEGSPSMTELTPAYSPHRYKHRYDPSQDLWKIHITQGLPEYSLGMLYGCWIIPFKYSAFDLTYYWHKLKFLIEKGEIPAARMECVAPKTQLDSPAIQVFTSEAKMMEVGTKALQVVKRSVYYVVEGHSLTWERPMQSLDDSSPLE